MITNCCSLRASRQCIYVGIPANANGTAPRSPIIGPVIKRKALVLVLAVPLFLVPAQSVSANPSGEQLVQQLLDEVFTTSATGEGDLCGTAQLFGQDFAIDFITDSVWAESPEVSAFVSSKTRFRFLVMRALRRACPNLNAPGISSNSKPSAPQKVSVEPLAGGKAQLSWKRPKSPKSGSLTYTVTSQPGKETCQTKKLKCTVSKLKPGMRYSFVVKVENSSGSAKSRRTARVLLPAAAASRPTSRPTPTPPRPPEPPKPPAEIS